MKSFIRIVVIPACVLIILFVYVLTTRDQYSIVVDSNRDANVVSNKDYGISVTVPKDWIVSKGSSESSLMRIDKNLSTDDYGDLTNGIMFEIYKHPKEFVDTSMWDIVTIQNKKAYKIESQVITQAEDSFEDVFLEHSKVVSYLIEQHNTYIELQCTAIGETYSESIKECEEIIHSIQM